MPAQQPHDQLLVLSAGSVAPRCLHVVAELGVADHLDDEPVSVADLAAACGADVESLHRMLRLLAVHGVFTAGDGGWVHTASSRLLRSDHPMSMRPFVRMVGLPFWLEIAAGYEHSLRTGVPAGETLHPDGMWGYLRDHPAEGEIFNQAMTAKAAGDSAAVLAAYDFAPFGTIADIGGGRGHLLRAVLDATPNARGVLFDLPDVIAGVDVEHPRLTSQGGDFFGDPLPAADAYVLMEVIHNWADEQAAAILGAVRKAANTDAKLLIIEGFVPADGEDLFALPLDIMMMTAIGGRERTPDQLTSLFRQTGFEFSRVVETGVRMRIVEATAV